MHYNEKRHIYSHKALSVSVHVSPSSETEYLHPLSLMIWSGALFPTHLLFYPAFTPNIHTIPFFFLLLFSVNVRVPCFPLGCPVGCVNVPCPLCNISWVAAACSVTLHNLPATVRRSMRVLFLCLFEPQIWSPNGDDIKLGAESQAAPPTQVKPFHLPMNDMLHKRRTKMVV